MVTNLLSPDRLLSLLSLSLTLYRLPFVLRWKFLLAYGCVAAYAVGIEAERQQRRRGVTSLLLHGTQVLAGYLLMWQLVWNCSFRSLGDWPLGTESSFTTRRTGSPFDGQPVLRFPHGTTE
jgi:hypothetical protein